MKYYISIVKLFGDLAEIITNSSGLANVNLTASFVSLHVWCSYIMYITSLINTRKHLVLSKKISPRKSSNMIAHWISRDGCGVTMSQDQSKV